MSVMRQGYGSEWHLRSWTPLPHHCGRWLVSWRGERGSGITADNAFSRSRRALALFRSIPIPIAIATPALKPEKRCNTGSALPHWYRFDDGRDGLKSARFPSESGSESESESFSDSSSPAPVRPRCSALKCH